MDINQIVYPKNLRANGLWNIFTGKKAYVITCGGCGHIYKDKVYFNMGNIASSLCPSCHLQNKWLHSDWDRFYSEQLSQGK